MTGKQLKCLTKDPSCVGQNVQELQKVFVKPEGGPVPMNMISKCIIIVKITPKGCYPNPKNKPPTDFIQPTILINVYTIMHSLTTY